CPPSWPASVSAAAAAWADDAPAAAGRVVAGAALPVGRPVRRPDPERAGGRAAGAAGAGADRAAAARPAAPVLGQPADVAPAAVADAVPAACAPGRAGSWSATPGGAPGRSSAPRR